ncbi:hypothetical protein [Streptomyces sp. NPDC000851]
MSDLDALGNPEHVCGAQCLDHEPLTDRDLESLEESAHIDALYAELNLVREHCALMFLALAEQGAPVVVTPRAASVMLDLSESELCALLGNTHHKPQAVVDHAIRVAGEDGYIGRAMVALMRAQLFVARPADSGDEGDES